jgi:cell division transport system ATP-binding protein
MTGPRGLVKGQAADAPASTLGAIHISDLTAGYGGPPVLESFDLDVRSGEFLYVVGPSGAGKSTLLKLVHGTLRPQKGSIVVDGLPVHRLRPGQVEKVRRQVGHVFQTYELLPYLTALENVLLPLQLTHPKVRNARDYAVDALELVGLGDRLKRRPGGLSVGEQQRVAVARAIAAQPRILLADEPTGNLDSQSTAEMVELFRELNSMGSTVLMATHDEMVLSRYPARAVRLRSRPALLEVAS